MDVLQKITELRLARNWSAYQLAEKSGLSTSTISSWYSKNLIPSIPSLEKICQAFGITLSEFFINESDTIISVTPEQATLIRATSRLSTYQLKLITDFINTIDK